MKKAVVMIVLALFLLSACSAGGSAVTFKATVDSVDGGSIMVTTVDTKDFDKASVHISESTKITKDGQSASLSDIAAGDTLTIGFNGIVAESYPVQLTADTIQIEKSKE
jgi:uncharacterized lipoprotein YajG